MSEVTKVLTYCDLCNLDQVDDNFVALEGQENEEEPVGFFRGVWDGPEDEALHVGGWVDRDFGVICPTCQKEEIEQAERDMKEEAVTLSFNADPAPSAIPLVEAPKKRRGRKKKTEAPKGTP